MLKNLCSGRKNRVCLKNFKLPQLITRFERLWHLTQDAPGVFAALAEQLAVAGVHKDAGIFVKVGFFWLERFFPFPRAVFHLHQCVGVHPSHLSNCVIHVGCKQPQSVPGCNKIWSKPWTLRFENFCTKSLISYELGHFFHIF